MLNPARVRDPARLAGTCRAEALAGGWRPVCLDTAAADAGAGAALEAVAAGADLVVAVGGDGTVRACATVLAGTRIPLGIVPRGAANIVARALGLPSALRAAIAVALRGRDRTIDLGVAEGEPFVAMAGIGLDAAVVGATPARLKDRVGWLGYAVAAIPRLPGGRHGFGVGLDGAAPLDRRARSVVVGNSGLLPGGFALLPDAELDDGRLDVGILAPERPGDWALLAGRVLRRDRRADPRLERHLAQVVEIRSDGDLPRQLDGEPIARGRSLSVTVRPAALVVRISRAGSAGTAGPRSPAPR